MSNVKFKTGKKNLIAEWWNSVKDRLLSRAEKLTGDHETAKDLVQQVALAVLIYRGPFHNEEHFLKWTYQKLKWFSLDYFRKMNREQSLFDKNANSELFSNEPSQENAHIISELSIEIQKLPGNRLKEVAYRYYLKHEDIKKIAADLKIKQSTVRSFLCHARSILVDRFKNVEIKEDK